MGYKYDESAILAAAVDVVLETGLSTLTFARVAERVGVADRTIVYYFPTKSDLLTKTVFGVGERLQRLLGNAFGDERLTEEELVRRAWPILASVTADPVFAVFFELVGLAAASVAPFDVLAPAVLESWIDWLVPRIDEPEQAARAAAYSIVATLDGLLLLRHMGGAAAADLAAGHLGVTPQTPRPRRPATRRASGRYLERYRDEAG